MRHPLWHVARFNKLPEAEFIRIATHPSRVERFSLVEENGGFSVSTFFVDDLVEEVKNVMQSESESVNLLVKECQEDFISQWLFRLNRKQ